MYKKGYKCRLIEEKSDIYIIDLYPDDLKSDLIRVRLEIGKPNFDLCNLEYKRKDGISINLYVNEYNLTFKPTSGSFVFQAEEFKGVEIIDMR